VERPVSESERATFADCERSDVRAGTIVAADDLPQARQPAIPLTIDFGDVY